MSAYRAPEHVIVVGAGMIGLATAWFLHESGVAVTVIDREGVAAGSSWGNAGWLTPAIATPLPEPAVLKYGVRAVLQPSSPVYVPMTASPRLLEFLLRFARNSTAARWKSAMGKLIALNRLALGAFDRIEGVQAVRTGPFLAAYLHANERSVLLEELQQIHAAGQDVDYQALTGDELRQLEPAVSSDITAGLLLHGQRFLDPGRFVHSLADALRTRGVSILSGLEASSITPGAGQVAVSVTGSEPGLSGDAVVLATGARLNALARPFGVRTLVQAGRGYSFSVKTEQLPGGPLYFPSQRVACTPIGDRLRVAGMMEFRRVDDPFDPRRIQAIVDAARPLLQGADLDDRQDEWVGSRPCTASGLPVIGQTRSDRVFVAGGHGMWGMTLGPITGELLARQIVTGLVPAELVPFAPG